MKIRTILDMGLLREFVTKRKPTEITFSSCYNGVTKINFIDIFKLIINCIKDYIPPQCYCLGFALYTSFITLLRTLFTLLACSP